MYSSKDIFKSLHFTLISLIQSVVLSLIVTQKLPNFRQDTPIFYISLLQSACLFLAILLITYEYFALYTIQRHKEIKFVDVFLPITIGLCQFLILKFVLEERCKPEAMSINCLSSDVHIGRNLSYWYASFMVLSLAAFCAYKNTQRRLKDFNGIKTEKLNKALRNNKPDHERVFLKFDKARFESHLMLNHVAEEIKFCILLSVLCLTFFVIDLICIGIDANSWLRVLNLFMFFVVMLFISSTLVIKGDYLVDVLSKHKSKNLRSKVYDDYGFDFLADRQKAREIKMRGDHQADDVAGYENKKSPNPPAEQAPKHNYEI
mgnify:CR=1 FL=1|jgi:hypothetical protein